MQRFGRGPGYPVFLAPLTWLDADLRAGRLPADVPAAVKIVQAILGAAAILVLAGLVRRVAGDRAGIAAAWIAALFPPLVWMPAYALSEQLASVAGAGMRRLARRRDRWPAGRARRPRRHHARARGRRARRRHRRADAPGAAVLPAAGGAAAGVARARSPHRPAPRRPVHASLALAAIAPWTVRNAIVHRQFVPIASSGGVNFWIGNHREAIGDGDLAANPHLKLRNAEFRARHAGLSEEALEPLYYREALGFIAADPVWWLGLEARKLWYTFMPFGPSYRLHAPRYFWASAVSLLLLLPAAVVRARPAAVGHAPGRPPDARRVDRPGRPGVLPARAFPAARAGSGAHCRGRALRVARAVTTPSCNL